ncbi:hypothetical protein AB3N04_19600 [Alkalihalophilus sp. As8PL]|uniref:SipL SPOCS domain-containing protein n=1 Tax=Alkalihalophilus sp. As8PL TaxID=3237103 RepID=A0AB39BTB6_9BACI
MMEQNNNKCINEIGLTNEPVLIQSVICSKEVKLIAYTKTNLKVKDHDQIQFVPDLKTTEITGTLLHDLIILQGFIKGSILVNNRCIKQITLAFQEEICCEDVCPGDTLKKTSPLLKGIVPPQIIPCEEAGYSQVIFKVILGIQITVIREKIGKVAVTIIGDVDKNGCKTSTTPPQIICYQEAEKPKKPKDPKRKKEEDKCRKETKFEESSCFSIHKKKKYDF